MEYYNQEKTKAVERYIKEKFTDVEPTVINGIRKEPSIVNDEQYRHAGAQYSKRFYMLGLYKIGVSPIDILKNMKGFFDIAERGRRKTLNAVSTAASVSGDILNQTANSRGLDEISHPIVVKTSRPSIEEIKESTPK